MEVPIIINSIIMGNKTTSMLTCSLDAAPQQSTYPFAIGGGREVVRVTVDTTGQRSHVFSHNA